jgi:hypothetical protein
MESRAHKIAQHPKHSHSKLPKNLGGATAAKIRSYDLPIVREVSLDRRDGSVRHFSSEQLANSREIKRRYWDDWPAGTGHWIDVAKRDLRQSQNGDRIDSAIKFNENVKTEFRNAAHERPHGLVRARETRIANAQARKAVSEDITSIDPSFDLDVTMPKDKPPAPEGMKWCFGPAHTPQGALLPKADFAAHKNNSDGLQNNCRACYRVWGKRQTEAKRQSAGPVRIIKLPVTDENQIREITAEFEARQQAPEPEPVLVEEEPTLEDKKQVLLAIASDLQDQGLIIQPTVQPSTNHLSKWLVTVVKEVVEEIYADNFLDAASEFDGTGEIVEVTRIST